MADGSREKRLLHSNSLGLVGMKKIEFSPFQIQWTSTTPFTRLLLSRLLFQRQHKVAAIHEEWSEYSSVSWCASEGGLDEVNLSKPLNGKRNIFWFVNRRSDKDLCRRLFWIYRRNWWIDRHRVDYFGENSLHSGRYKHVLALIFNVPSHFSGEKWRVD